MHKEGSVYALVHVQQSINHTNYCTRKVIFGSNKPALNLFSVCRMEKKHKPRTAKLALRTPHKPKAKDAPKSSAWPVIQIQSNLTLQDWLTVFAFIDSHPDMSQENFLTYFKTWAEGALYFDQSILSRKNICWINGLFKWLDRDVNVTSVLAILHVYLIMHHIFSVTIIMHYALGTYIL